jgi:IS605 OrfB family transposase
MALDVNSGHVDFGVVDKDTLKPVVSGKFNCYQMVDAGQDKKRILIHRLVKKVRNIAKHYNGEVVVGRLHTAYTGSCHHFNRRVQGMNQYAMREVMRYKLPLDGVRFRERSEANTSKLGAVLSKPLGLDVHKAAAYAFAVKVADYDLFKSFLRGVHADEGDGIPSIGLSGGSEQTALHQSWRTWLMHNDPLSGGEATPNQGKGGVGHADLQTPILQVKV